MRKVVVFLEAQYGVSTERFHYAFTQELAHLMGYKNLCRYGLQNRHFYKLDDHDRVDRDPYLSDDDQGLRVSVTKFKHTTFRYINVDRERSDIIELTEEFVAEYPEFSVARIIEIPDDFGAIAIIREKDRTTCPYETICEASRVYRKLNNHTPNK